jgi:prepilin-type processing-associated H-X9-DG protein
LKAGPSVVENQNGFTYVELVTLILAVNVFAVVFLPGLSRARYKSMQTRCVSNLKRIGLAFQIYAKGHQDMLPGAVLPVPQAGYNETSKQELAWYIAEDLGCPKPSKKVAIATNLLCPAYRLPWSEPTSLATAKTYALNENINGQRGFQVPPFGSLAQPLSAPIRLSLVANYGPPFRICATTDGDKATVGPTVPSWKEVPYQPVHGKMRNRLFFDGHVEVRAW